MKNKYKMAFLITLGFLIGVTLPLLFNYVTVKSKYKNKENQIREETVNKKIEKTLDDKKEQNTENSEEKLYSNQNIDIQKDNQIETSNFDDEILNYLENKKGEIDSKISDTNYKEKAKKIFIEIVDFLFYNGRIKNHTFNELSEKTKLEVIKISIKIEDKIEQFQPGLIDNLDSKYTNIKLKIVNLYDLKIDEYCHNNSNLCSKARSDYNSMKRTFKYAFGTIKSKISDFYQEKFKNN